MKNSIFLTFFVLIAFLTFGLFINEGVNHNAKASTKTSSAQLLSVPVPCFNALNMPLNALQAEIILSQQSGVRINYNGNLNPNGVYASAIKSFRVNLFKLDSANNPIGFIKWEVNMSDVTGNSVFLRTDDREFLTNSPRYALVVDYVAVGTKGGRNIKQQPTTKDAINTDLRIFTIDVNHMPSLLSGDIVIAEESTQGPRFCEQAIQGAIIICSGQAGIRKFECDENTKIVVTECVGK